MDLFLGLICTFCGGLLAIGGIALVILGCYGLLVGFHGGWIAALVPALFGAGLAFVGFYCGRYGLRLVHDYSERNKRSAQQ
jgi:hypothetical protein